MKVVLEVSVISVEIRKLKPHSRVIASSQGGAFGNEARKSLSVEEILAMPIERA